MNILNSITITKIAVLTTLLGSSIFYFLGRRSKKDESESHDGSDSDGESESEK